MTYTAHERRLQRRRAYLARYTYNQYKGIPTSLVPSREAADHLAALHTLGWSNRALQALTNNEVHASTLSKLTREHYATLQRATANGILNIPLTLAPTNNVPNTCLVPALGAQRRIQALMFAQWSHPLIREAAGGVDTSGVVRGRCNSIRAGAWRSIDAAFRELSMRLGPDAKVGTHAKRLHYRPALSWTDIDRPDDKPTGFRRKWYGGSGHNSYDEAVVVRILAGEYRLEATRAERREVVRRWNLPDPLAARHGAGDDAAFRPSLAYLGRLTGWKVERYVTRDEEMSA